MTMEAGCSIKVSGIPAGLSEDLLCLYFENTKRSGGGSVVKVVFSEDPGTAIITFEDAGGKLFSSLCVNCF